MPPLSPLHTPVLLVIFNRPETTQVVFEAIRRAKPPRLYVAADGPRPNVESDVQKCQEARQIVNLVDWDCEVKTLFRNENLNAGRGVASAVTWFFENEEAGIILEDDCLPSQSFFLYCQDLLTRYATDNRVMHIGGNNFLNGWQNDKEYSYYFSRNGHVWGWASWRRSWKLFDFNITKYTDLKAKGYFDEFFLNRIEKAYRLRYFERTVAKRGNVAHWDYQWDFARFINSGLAIVPAKNLVRNIGFGPNATHTKDTFSAGADLENLEIDFPLNHPPYVIRDIGSDDHYFSGFIKGRIKSKLKSLNPLSS